MAISGDTNLGFLIPHHGRAFSIRSTEGIVVRARVTSANKKIRRELKEKERAQQVQSSIVSSVKRIKLPKCNWCGKRRISFAAVKRHVSSGLIVQFCSEYCLYKAESTSVGLEDAA